MLNFVISNTAAVDNGTYAGEVNEGLLANQKWKLAHFRGKYNNGYKLNEIDYEATVTVEVTFRNKNNFLIFALLHITYIQKNYKHSQNNT